jgi:hypothetical protein
MIPTLDGVKVLLDLLHGDRENIADAVEEHGVVA